MNREEFQTFLKENPGTNTLLIPLDIWQEITQWCPKGVEPAQLVNDEYQMRVSVSKKFRTLQAVNIPTDTRMVRREIEVYGLNTSICSPFCCYGAKLLDELCYLTGKERKRAGFDHQDGSPAYNRTAPCMLGEIDDGDST